MTKPLTNSKVIILRNDFIDRDVVATITDVAEDHKAMLLKTLEPLEFNNEYLNYVVVNSRLEKESFESLKTKKTTGCGAIWLSKENLNPLDPFDTSWWRGGLASITSLKLL